MNRRVLLIIAFILIVIVFGALIYFVFLRDLFGPETNANNANTPTNQVTNGVLPNTNSATNGVPVNGLTNVNRLVNIEPTTNVNAGPDQIAQGGETLAGYVASADAEGVSTTPDGNGIRFYDRDQGLFFMLDSLGTKVKLSEQLFPQAESIVWAPKSNKAIVTYPDQSKIVYDFDRQSQVTLPREWTDVAFNPNGDKLAFKNESTNTDDRWLAISNADGSQVQGIEPLGDNGNNVDVNWSPTGQVVATYREAQNASQQEVYLVGTQGENFKSIPTDGRGFEGTWSPDASQLLYSVYNADSRYNPVLYLVDASGDSTGGNTVNLGLQTWSFKCAFAHGSPAAYCAVPRFLPDGSGIVPEVATNTNDLIYRINTDTGIRTLVAMPSLASGNENYTVVNVVMSNDDRRLYFTDANTGNIYSIQLQ